MLNRRAGCGDLSSILEKLINAKVCMSVSCSVVRSIKPVQSQLKANAVKQESDKFDEMKRAAVRVVSALNHLPGAGSCLDVQTLAFVLI